MTRSAAFSTVLFVLAAMTSCAIFSVRLPCKADSDCPDGQACAADKLCATLVERGGDEGEGAEGEGGEGEGEGQFGPGTGPGGGNRVSGIVKDGLEFVLRVTAPNFDSLCTDSCSTDHLGACTVSWSASPLTVQKNDDGTSSIAGLPDGTWVVFMEIPPQAGGGDVETTVTFADEDKSSHSGSFTYLSRVDDYIVTVANGKFTNVESSCDVEVDDTPADQSVLCSQVPDSDPPPNTFASCLVSNDSP